jgi:FAD/FMN-containing dehydrogenase
MRPAAWGRLPAALLAALLFACSLLASAGPVVNDITRLNPIAVERIVAPRHVDEIVAAVRAHPGPVSVGGGRYSMGGQTATEGALHLDMRSFDQVVRFEPHERAITVQAGITWRKIQDRIDPFGLSLQIMQSYANFTVGGSLSVNAHGRYVGQGPLVASVRSLRMVLADGSLVDASPDANAELFYGAIGGYGGLGVIVEATLALTDNLRVERSTQTMSLSAYRQFFFAKIAQDPHVIFHNATLYPDGYDTVRAVSFTETDKAVTDARRLSPVDADYPLQQRLTWVTSELPGGKRLRQHVIDPLLYASHLVEWRNLEASFDVKSLEPASRDSSTYVLQEYFVPVARLEEFAGHLRTVLNRHQVNALNVSIRHAKRDPGTLLAWAREDVFAFVLYYKQGTDPKAREQVGVWTRELIDAATALGGAWYLPYQIHATPAQFRAAYPGADRYFALKARVDPSNKFRNKLWDAYYSPPVSASGLNAARP